MKNTSIIVAATKSTFGIGYKNSIPWNIPKDMKRFKELTSGSIIVMGRKTFESIDRCLPNRQTVILTRKKNYSVEGALIFFNITELRNYLNTVEKQVFIIGGTDLYKEFLQEVERIYFTEITGDYICDTFFPKIPEGIFDLIFKEKHTGYNFKTFQRKDLNDLDSVSYYQ